MISGFTLYVTLLNFQVYNETLYPDEFEAFVLPEGVVGEEIKIVLTKNLESEPVTVDSIKVLVCAELGNIYNT